jgi:DNA-binding PadR family transcriptional regulator
MRSPVSWALLGLVIQRPSYGYELVQRFERTFTEALELSSPSQIYTALDTLARRALVEEFTVKSDAAGVVRQPKPHYRATGQGICDYRHWLIAQAQDERRRSRLFARELAVLAPRDALAVLERYEQACLKRASSSPAPALDEGSPEAADGALAARLVREEERLAIDARLAWIEYARRELVRLAPEQTTRR